ncbi:MAG: hypothetical protein AB1430_20325, partial [Pseudomonadota bacterium]
GIGQVNTAVTQLDQMTQQNAALVEESAAAAESLKDQAHKLAGLVSTFRLGDGSSQRLAAALQATAALARPAPGVARSAPAPQAAAHQVAAQEVIAKVREESRPVEAPKPLAAPAAVVAAPAPAAAPAAAVPPAKADDGEWETF